VIDPVKNFPFI